MHPPLLGNHPAIIRLRRSLPSLGENAQPLVVIGDAGVGKTFFAEHIHQYSAYKKVECLIFNAALLEDHAQRTLLFGGEPPMLTTTRRGIIERSTTVVIKNAEMLRPYLQDDLARAMVTGETTRAGSRTKRPLLCRLIFTFRLPPAKLFSRGFLVDPLISVLRDIKATNIPTLRSRKSDIPILARYFTKRLQAMFPNANTSLIQNSSSRNRIRPDLSKFLKQQPWPGNITQLRAFIRSLLVHTPKDILMSSEYQEVNMMLENIEAGRGFFLENSMQKIEQAIVSRAVQTTGGNIRKAGYLLGLTESSIHRRKRSS